jgi:hypothetical protein
VNRGTWRFAILLVLIPTFALAAWRTSFSLAQLAPVPCTRSSSEATAVGRCDFLAPADSFFRRFTLKSPRSRILACATIRNKNVRRLNVPMRDPLRVCSF